MLIVLTFFFYMKLKGKLFLQIKKDQYKHFPTQCTNHLIDGYSMNLVRIFLVKGLYMYIKMLG